MMLGIITGLCIAYSVVYLLAQFGRVRWAARWIDRASVVCGYPLLILLDCGSVWSGRENWMDARATTDAVMNELWNRNA